MWVLATRRGPARLPTISGGPGQGKGGGDPLARGYLVQRTTEGPAKHRQGYEPPRYGCGCSVLAVVALAIAISPLRRLG
jgi:hypothetical protein